MYTEPLKKSRRPHPFTSEVNSVTQRAGDL